MNRLFRITVLLCFVSLFVSCEKDKEKDGETELKSLTPEQHKEQLNKSGVAFIDDISGMSSESIIGVLDHFTMLMDEYELEEEDMPTGTPLAFLKQISTIGKDPVNALKLKSITDDYDDDDYESISEFFNDLAGEYTFNKTEEIWKNTSASDDIVFIFPSSESAMSNNAQVKIYDFSAVVASQQDIEDFTYELVSSIKIDVSVDGSSVFSTDMSSEYHTDDAPKKMDMMMTMGAYSWKNGMDMSTPTEKASMSSEYKKGDDIILSCGFTANGDFTYENLKNTLDNEDSDGLPEKATAFLQVEDVRFDGEIDIKKLMKADEAAYEKYDASDYTSNDDKIYMEELVEAFTENVKLELAYDDEVSIGSLEFFVDEYEDDWGKDYDLGVRLKFEDDSYMDDSYFEGGFTLFIDRLNKFIDQINEEHNAELDYVEE